jgi:hypothetical protein
MKDELQSRTNKKGAASIALSVLSRTIPDLTSHRGMLFALALLTRRAVPDPVAEYQRNKTLLPFVWHSLGFIQWMSHEKPSSSAG